MSSAARAWRQVPGQCEAAQLEPSTDWKLGGSQLQCGSQLLQAAEQEVVGQLVLSTRGACTPHTHTFWS